MRELSFDEINAVAGGGFSDAAQAGASTGAVVGLVEAGLAGSSGVAAATTIGAWSVVGGALAVWGYGFYAGATYLGAGTLGGNIGGMAYDYLHGSGG